MLRHAIILVAALATATRVSAQTVPVVIENPQGLVLELMEVEDDTSRLRRTLGTNPEVKLDLPWGWYWIRGRAKAGEARYPLPLPRRALRPETVRLRILPPPPAPEGFAWIPAGWSLQGDPLGVGDEDERPARLVKLAGYFISIHEVTNRQYAGFLTAQKTIDPGWLDLESPKCRVRRPDAESPWHSDHPDHPVVTVSWRGARAYAAWRSRVTGAPHRLPRESEWEKAARGPESFRYHYGNVFRRAAANQESGRLLPVGRFSPNGFGLHDFTGNAFEWVEDAYDRHAYSRENPVTTPTHAPYRVLRGGSYVLDGIYLRNSFRMRHRPTVQADDFGFRILREAPIKETPK